MGRSIGFFVPFRSKTFDAFLTFFFILAYFSAKLGLWKYACICMETHNKHLLRIQNHLMEVYGRDGPYKCCCFSARSAQGEFSMGKNKSKRVSSLKKKTFRRIHLQTECIACKKVLFYSVPKSMFCPLRWYSGSGLDCRSDEPGSIPRHTLNACGHSGCKEVKDVFRRPVTVSG